MSVMFSEMWNVKLCLNLWETNKVHVHFCNVHLGNWPFFISCNYLRNKTQRIIMLLFCLIFFPLSFCLFFFNSFFFFLLIYISVYLFSLFSSFWNFKHIKDAKVIALKAIFQVELGNERLHHSPNLGSGASSINITKSLLRSCISLCCKSALCSGHHCLLQDRWISA